MTEARRKEGPCAPLFFSAAALLLLSGEWAAAQSVDLSSLEICANLETSELKLACFEAIIAAGKSPGEQVPETTAGRAADNAPAAAVPGIAVSATPGNEPEARDPAADNAPAAALPGIAVSAAPGNEPETSEPAAVTAAAPGIAAAASEPEPVVAENRVAQGPAPAALATQSNEQYTREQAAPPDQEEKEEAIQATVVEVTRSYNRTLDFHLANGQVWRQAEARHLQYPKGREFEIEITQGMMGDYRMRIGDNSRMVGIRRIK